MSYYNQDETDETEDEKMLYQIWYDHPEGSTVDERRAVDEDAAKDIVRDGRTDIVVTEVQKVAE